MFNIVTWNLNGIRSSQQDLKTLFDSLNADIICLQETKITRGMLDAVTALVDGYNSYYSFSRKRSGYSGVATYCKNSCIPFQAEEGIAGTYSDQDDSIKHCDGVHSSFTDDELRGLDAEGRCVITLHHFKQGDPPISENTLVIINVYCPNAGDNDERLPYKLQFFRALNLRCQDLLSQGYHVIVLGDMNVSHRLIDHCEPEDVINFSKTPSRIWFESFLKDGGGEFVDSFRHLYPTREKSFTCWNTKINARVNNYGTRIDYILLSSKLVPSLQDCTIMSDVYGSDHCPVRATLELELISSVKFPSICTKNFKEFSGKQLKISSFVCKRTLTSTETSVTESEPKKAKISSSDKQQSSLLKFFSSNNQVPVDPPIRNLPTKLEEYGKETDDLTSVKAQSCNSSSSAALWKNVFKGPPPPPLCSGHQEPCVLRTVKKKGPNMNKQFWACSRAAGHSSDNNSQCNFFLWFSAKR